MKKIIYLALAACCISLFSSCVVVTPKHWDDFDFTFNNNTSKDIGDWYLKDDDGHNHSKRGKEANRVESDEKDTFHELDRGTYRVYFSYYYDPDYCDYYKTNYFDLDHDTEFRLRSEKFYNRSAVTADGSDESEPVLYLEDSNGNIIQLEKVTNLD